MNSCTRIRDRPSPQREIEVLDKRMRATGLRPVRLLSGLRGACFEASPDPPVLSPPRSGNVGLVNEKRFWANGIDLAAYAYR